MLGLVCQVGVAGSGEDGVVTKEFLHFDQVDASFDQVGRVAVPQAVWCDLFFRPQA
ncbi:MAG: hypothetical protein JWR56_912 [Massilia sp.]|nr:hypothetical protein [Massilia sp.]